MTNSDHWPHRRFSKVRTIQIYFEFLLSHMLITKDAAQNFFFIMIYDASMPLSITTYMFISCIYYTWHIY